jgi:hypothetical protein
LLSLGIQIRISTTGYNHYYWTQTGRAQQAILRRYFILEISQ